MSRLHRARQSLKEVMEQMTEYKDTPAVPDDRFKEVVQAEIALLLKMFADEPNAGERLSIVLGKSPERIAELVADGEDPAANLALLLPHLGGEAIDIVLDCYFSGREPAAVNALALLRRSSSRFGTVGHRDGMADMSSRDAYLVLERILDHSAGDAAKAGILIEMIDSCAHSCPATLYANALQCFPEALSGLLMERYRDAGGASPWVIHALVRTGAQFASQVLDMLRSGDTGEQSLALQGFEAIARSICPPWLDGATPEQFQNDLRTREKWPPLRCDDVPAELISDLTQQTAGIVSHGPAELRAAAIRVLGYLGAGEYTSLLAACLSDDDASTRLAAIFALSEIGSLEIVDALMDRARAGDVQEQAAAAAALGRLGVARAEHVLVEMTRSAHSQVREAAVAALGEMGSVSSQVVLQELMRSGDPKLQKVAAKAAFGGVKRRTPEVSEVSRRLAEKRRKVSPVAVISPDAALRFGLTELASYEEQDLTERIARICSDYCATRRYMVELGLMSREGGVYQFTESGKSAWRVERFICERYLSPAT
jgi:hypothetical protein